MSLGKLKSLEEERIKTGERSCARMVHPLAPVAGSKKSATLAPEMKCEALDHRKPAIQFGFNFAEGGS